MSSLQKQCQTRLQLERTVVLARLQRGNVSTATYGSSDAVVTRQVAQQLQSKLHSIERALQRLDSQQYGRCQQCGQPIAEERLLALPHAELCISCQRQIERQVLGGGRRFVAATAH